MTTQLLKGFAKDVENLKPHPTKRLTVGDPDTRGLFVRVTPAGGKTWLIVARNPERKQIWATIGEVGKIPLSEARTRGRNGVDRIKKGLPPFEEEVPEKAPETFKTVAQRFLERHVQKQALRSAGEIERQFKVYVYPAWEDEPFISIRRGRVVELLHKIEDENGSVMADRVLATLRKMFNWVEVNGEDEEYKSPIVRGMRITSSKARARKRKLSDDEIRALWADWGTAGTFGAFLKTCLLTSQRRAKVLTLKWDDVSDKGVWTITAEDREKVNAGSLKLPKLALDVIRSQKRIKGNPYVFAGRGEVPIGNIGNDKRKMDERVALGEPWTIHDLRRTAKSLMSRAGVRPDISERTLGHVIPGSEGVYEQHDWEREKAKALEKLAVLVGRILNPPKGNVVQMKSAA